MSGRYAPCISKWIVCFKLRHHSMCWWYMCVQPVEAWLHPFLSPPLHTHTHQEMYLLDATHLPSTHTYCLHDSPVHYFPTSTDPVVPLPANPLTRQHHAQGADGR
jgi:hypothetical protein